MDRSILITGCSSGIGYAAAHALHKLGYTVFATARNQKDVARLKDEGLDAYRLDVTDAKSIASALETILEKSGGTLYAVFNNAGYGQPGALEDVPLDALREQFETNVFGLHEVTRRVLPVMRAQGYGRIIQHSSVLGIVSLRFRGAYNASKYAIEGLCDTLRLELDGTGIHVITLNTGPVRSNFRDNAIKMFYKYINADNSIFRDSYASEVLRRKEKKEEKDLFTKDPDAVIEKLRTALESEHPRPRYYVTAATHLLGALKRVLPTARLDRILKKI
jgi:NAD(P)-dependent dehydrogenase (short-subunit alcohol dehydrogenase family)